MDKLLQSLGLKNIDYSDLTQDERETYKEMLRVLEAQTLTMEGLKEYISNMLLSVSKELADTTEKDKEKNIKLKARLQNYFLLDSFFKGPEKARKLLEQQLGAKLPESTKTTSIG